MVHFERQRVENQEGPELKGRAITTAITIGLLIAVAAVLLFVLLAQKRDHLKMSQELYNELMLAGMETVIARAASFRDCAEASGYEVGLEIEESFQKNDVFELNLSVDLEYRKQFLDWMEGYEPSYYRLPSLHKKRDRYKAAGSLGEKYYIKYVFTINRGITPEEKTIGKDSP